MKNLLLRWRLSFRETKTRTLQSKISLVIFSVGWSGKHFRSQHHSSASSTVPLSPSSVKKHLPRSTKRLSASPSSGEENTGGILWANSRRPLLRPKWRQWEVRGLYQSHDLGQKGSRYGSERILFFYCVRTDNIYQYHLDFQFHLSVALEKISYSTQ